MSLRPSMAGGEQIARDLEDILRSAEELRRPIELADARLEDYDAVYYPGGHGPMEDLWKDADSGRLLTAALPRASRWPSSATHRLPSWPPDATACHRLPATVSRRSPTTKKTRSACGKELSGRPRTSWSNWASTSPAVRFGSPTPSWTAICTPVRTQPPPRRWPRKS